MSTTPHILASLHDLGGLVRAARLARRLTQAELAARLGVGVRLLSELEQGTRDLRTSNLLHVMGRLGFDLRVVPRGAPATGAAEQAAAPELARHQTGHQARQQVRQRVRHATMRKKR